MSNPYNSPKPGYRPPVRPSFLNNTPRTLSFGNNSPSPLQCKRPKFNNNSIRTVGPFTETESQRKLNRQLEVLYDELGFEYFIVIGSVALMIHCFASNLVNKTNCLNYDIGDIDMVTEKGYGTILDKKRDINNNLSLIPKDNITIKEEGVKEIDFNFPFYKGISLEYEKDDFKFEFDYIEPKPLDNLPPIDMYYQFSENREKKVGILSFKNLKSEYKDAEEDIEMLKNETKKGKLMTKLQILNKLEKQQQSGGKRRSVKKSKNQKKSKRNNSTKNRRRTKKKKPSKN